MIVERPIDQRELRSLLKQYSHNEESLKDLCSNLNPSVPYDGLTGDGVPAKHISLIQYMKDRSRLPELYSAIQKMIHKRPQPARNDQPIGRDLLQVETAVHALAEMCMLEDLHPPIAVGILGGWGSGKSFVMHLMQERVARLRRKKITEDYPYVGHIYQIKFDAWTYAKSNLWASLIQTVFYKLNLQLTRERDLAEALKLNESELHQDKIPEILKEGGHLWQLLAYPDLSERQSHDVINFASELNEELRDKPPDQLRDIFEAYIQKLDRPDRSSNLQEKETGEFLWQKLEALKKAELVDLRSTEKDLANKQKALEFARIELQKKIDAQIDQEGREAAWKSLQGVFKQQFGKLYDAVEKQFKAEGTVSISETVGKKAELCQAIRNNPRDFVAFIVLAVVIGIFAAINQSLILQLPSALVAIGSAIMAFVRVYSKWLKLLKDSFLMYCKQVETERYWLDASREGRYEAALAEEKATFAQQLAPPQDAASIPALEQEVATLTAKVKRQRERVGITANYVSLLDFVSSRLDEAVYEKELGLMHQIQRDLHELSESLTADKTIKDLFPRGKPRIILYIDDLDRCPPQRVVEVLEAVQLLLKTDLFVVILAIDVRYITRALETAYNGILARKGNPSGLDYIEKIIQIPYRVPPVENEAVASYLQAQMDIALEKPDKLLPPPDLKPDNDTPSPQTEDLPINIIEVSQDEYDIMRQACQQVDMTPRVMKRLANVFKLIKIIWYRQGRQPTIDGKPDNGTQTVIAFLALSGRYPNQMRDIFDILALELEKPQLDEDPQQSDKTKLHDFIQAECERCIKLKQPVVFPWEWEREWERFMNDVEKLIPDTLVLRELESGTFNLIRSFSFVGDIGYDFNLTYNDIVDNIRK